MENQCEYASICKAAREGYMEEMTAFLKKHPHYCRRCGGEGDVPDVRRDEHGEYPDWVDCPDCVANYKCPLCAHDLSITPDGDVECKRCGWYPDGPAPSAPWVPGCIREWKDGHAAKCPLGIVPAIPTTDDEWREALGPEWFEPVQCERCKKETTLINCGSFGEFKRLCRECMRTLAP